MTRLQKAARAILACWDRIEEAKSVSLRIEDRLAILRPLHDEMKSAIEEMRDALTEER
jgi:hypothetical protein